MGSSGDNAKILPTADKAAITCTDEMIEDLYWATALAIIASYAQMFQCLRVLDEEFEFGLNLPATIATFRAGCILQGYLLQPMTKAFEANPNLSNLMCAGDALFFGLHRVHVGHRVGLGPVRGAA